MKSAEPNWLAEVSWTGDNVFLGTDMSGHTIVYDEADGTAKGIGPMRSLKVVLSGTRPEFGLPKPWTSIHIKCVLFGESLETKYVEEAIRDSADKFCSVGATLQSAARITHSYETVS